MMSLVSRWSFVKLGNEAALIHALRLRNIANEYKGLPSGHVYDLALHSVLDATEYRRWAFSLPILYDTPYGAAYRVKNLDDPRAYYLGGMTHVDKVLSVLGELGFSLNVEIVTDSERRATLADVLEDSLKRWSPEVESEWTLLAYCSYLNQQNTWVSADGRKRSVDEVLRAVLERRRGPCFATHRLYGLSRACMKTREAPWFFSNEIAREAENTVREASSHLATTQLPDGSWYPDVLGASENVGGAPDDEMRFQITAHLLECFAIMDSDLRPPRDTIDKAARYIEHKLAGPSAENCFCTYLLPSATHAIRGLFHLQDRRSLP